MENFKERDSVATVALQKVRALSFGKPKCFQVETMPVSLDYT